MNKISKKIVSLVTMAAFVLTLVPAAAFAAPAPTADVVAVTPVSDQTVVLDNSGKKTVEFTVKTGANWDTDDQIGFWAGTEASADANVKVAFTKDDDAALVNGSAPFENVDWYQNLSASTEYTVKATFDGEATCTLYAGVYDDSKADRTFEALAIQELGDYSVVTANQVVSVEDSALLIDEDDADAAATQGVDGKVEFMVTGANGAPTSEYALNAADGDAVYMWAELGSNRVVDDVDFGEVYADANSDTVIGYVVPTNTKDVYKVVDTGKINPLKVMDGYVVKFNFNDANNGYKIFAGVAADTNAPAMADIDEIEPITVNVAPADVEIEEITFDKVDGATGRPVDTGKDDVWTIDINDNVTASGAKVYTVTGYAYTDADTKAPAANKELSVTAKRGINLQGLSENGTVKTNARGGFEFSFTMNENGEYDIVVSEVDGDASATLRVNQDAVYVGNIKTVKDGGYLLAANDTKYADAKYVGTSPYFADAVQFELTDVNGNEVTGQIFGENAYTLSITKPEGSKLVADDLALVWDKANGVYTLQYTDSDKTGIAKDLIPGKYSVKVAFKSSDKAATATFNLAKFGTVQDIVLDMYAGPADWFNSSSNDAIEVIDDQVALGQSVQVVPSYVDENGIKVRAYYADLDAGVNGEAVVDNGYHWYNGLLYFDTYANEPANNSLIGTTITVKVFDEENGKYVEKELTVVKNYLGETLAFDPTNGVVGEDNKVAVSVVDEEGNLSKVNGELHAYVADQSNADAYVEVKVKNDNVKNGKGELTLYSDAEGTADVVVVVTADNGEMYGATLTYTFGAEDPNAENTVVMTIGSTDYVVNNDIIKGDAAPYVDAQWRTMVPFRVLGETFGAEVNWDQDTQTVTYTYGDTELTMTIGEETYTVNGTEKTMDTAPVLSGDRTYVPVRFVGEALGYTVTALQDGETGLTASVVFQK